MLINLNNIFDSSFMSIHLSHCFFFYIDKANLTVTLTIDYYLRILLTILPESG